ncbi:M24 family metallopeptidase [Chitinophaga sedimenti]|uniref:M24 family metallopeptidase n=1 Tax=Chitinophaga sedimenti TaxID=2033606 RepID=UPI0035585D24
MHDLGPSMYQPLPAGSVLTVEPGIYIEEEQLGIRIENNIWVTDGGNIDLMKNIPIKADEIEALMKKFPRTARCYGNAQLIYLKTLMKQVPNILTLANLFCGALAVIFILHAPEYIATFNGADYMVTNPAPVYWASGLVVLAGVFDFLTAW